MRSVRVRSDGGGSEHHKRSRTAKERKKGIPEIERRGNE